MKNENNPLKIIWTIISLVSFLGLAFYFGYLYGYRERFNQKENQVLVIGPNLSIQNSLSDIKTNPVLAINGPSSIANFGQLYYKITNENKTELRLVLENTPLTLNNQTRQVIIPESLTVYTAKLSSDGLDYEYTEIGTFVFNEPKNGTRSGDFNKVLDYPLASVDNRIDRLVLFAKGDMEGNIFLNQDPDIPIKARNRPSPFFWVELL